MLQALELLKINATNGKENFCQLSERELKAMKELAKREDKEKTNLQQRIDRLNKYIKEHSYDYAYQDCKFNEIEQYEDIKSILQSEEVKDNV